LLGLHLGARGVDPGHIFYAELLVIDSGQEPAAAQDRVFVAQRRQLLHKADQRPALFLYVPIGPADRVVLAIGVVVALLGAGEFVAGEHHRRALRQQQRREEIAPLAVAQSADLFVVGRTLGAAIPRTVVGMAVLVVFAVRFVVLVVVG